MWVLKLRLQGAAMCCLRKSIRLRLDVAMFDQTLGRNWAESSDSAAFPHVPLPQPAPCNRGFNLSGAPASLRPLTQSSNLSPDTACSTGLPIEVYCGLMALMHADAWGTAESRVIILTEDATRRLQKRCKDRHKCGVDMAHM